MNKQDLEMAQEILSDYAFGIRTRAWREKALSVLEALREGEAPNMTDLGFVMGVINESKAGSFHFNYEKHGDAVVALRDKARSLSKLVPA